MSTKHFCDRCHAETSIGTGGGSAMSIMFVNPLGGYASNPLHELRKVYCVKCQDALCEWLKPIPRAGEP